MNSVKKPTDQLSAPNTVVIASDAKVRTTGQWLVASLLLAIVIGGMTTWIVIAKHVQQKKLATTTVKVYAATPDNYPSVAGDIKSQISSTTDSKTKAVLYDQLALNAQTAGKTNDAVQAARNAEQLDPSGARAASLALLYQANNDWPNAVTWFQKAVDQTPKSADPRIDDAYNNYMSDLENAKSHL